MREDGSVSVPAWLRVLWCANCVRVFLPAALVGYVARYSAGVRAASDRGSRSRAHQGMRNESIAREFL